MAVTVSLSQLEGDPQQLNGSWQALMQSSHTTMQAEQLRTLRQNVDKTQELLQREQHRVQLLEEELLHLRSSQSACQYRRSGAHASVSEVRPRSTDGLHHVLSPAHHGRGMGGCFARKGHAHLQ